MISFFRRALSSWLVLGLLGLILVAFIVTGVGTPSGLGLTGASGDEVAKVGGAAIGPAEVTQALQRQLQQQQQQTPALDMAGFVRGGGFDATVDQVIASRALEAFGVKQGMVASRALVDGEIASIPGLASVKGKVDRVAFASFLQQQRMSEAQLRDAIAGDAVRRAVLFPVIGGSYVPATLSAHYASLLLEARAGSIAIVPATAMAGGAAPGDAAIGAYYRSHIAGYTLPERRILRYAAFGREDVAAKAKPSDAEIAADYKANAATYASREVRDVSQVVLDSEAKARAFAAKVAAGTPFPTAAATAGFTPADTKVGRKTQTELAAMASPAVAAAAFAARPGGISAPAKSDFGWHVVRVDGSETIPGRSLAAAHDEIAAKLAKQKGDSALSDLVVAVDDAISGGGSFDDVVRAQNLRVTITPPLVADGRSPDGAAASAEVKPLLSAAFQTGPDENPTVETVVPNERFALLAVARVLPAAPVPLAQVRAKVVADLGMEQAQQRAKAVAQAIVAKAAAGVPLATAIAQAGVRLPPPQVARGRRIDLNNTAKGGQVPPPLALMFSMRQGRTQLLEAPDKQGWFIVHLDTVTPGDAAAVPGLAEGTRRQLAQLVGDEYAEQFAHAAQAAVGASRNEPAIAKLKAGVAGGAPE